MTLPPRPGRRDPRRNSNTGEGGWAPWRPQGLGDRTGGLQGGVHSGTYGGSGESGVHGGSGDSGGPGGAGNLALIFSGGSGSSVALALGPATQAEVICPPQKNISWGSSPLVGTLEERALEVVLGSRTELAGAQESWTEPIGTRERRTGPAATKVSWAGPAETKVSWMGPTFGGARKAPVLVRARAALTHLGARAALTHLGARVALTHLGARAALTLSGAR